MRSRTEWTRRTRVFLLAAGTCAAVFVGASQRASAELRKFAVMLANSPKSHMESGSPGVPVGGLHSVQDIRNRYFGASNAEYSTFADYWKEISYGDVVITGDVFEWVSLPWVFEPDGPNQDARPSPADFINLNRNAMTACTSPPNPDVPGPYAYGAGEEFCDCLSSGDIQPSPITPGRCGALIIIDTTGTDGADTTPEPPPARGPGLDDVPVSGAAVWTPGERFIDLDGDMRWDGLDELNDRICMGTDGCRDPDGNSFGVCRRDFSKNSSFGFDAFGRLDSLVPCDLSDPHCPPLEICVDSGPGPVGCGTDGCGGLKMPAIDWDGSDDYSNSSGCLADLEVPNADQFTGMRRCDVAQNGSDGSNAGCYAPEGWQGDYPLCIDGFCVPENCRPPGAQTPPDCCTGDEGDSADCVPQEQAKAGINCKTSDQPVIECCEFDDYNDAGGSPAFLEPFEDFMVRWNPLATSYENAWIPVTDKYVRDNYPGDAEALVRRSGNGVYDSPDLFVDVGSTKMMQDAGQNQFGWKTPKPGAKYSSGTPNFEQPWFDGFWTSRYGTTPPPWPHGDAASTPNSPVMRPFDPAAPNPPIIAGTEDSVNGRWFHANAGGVSGLGLGTLDDRVAPFPSGSDDWSNYGSVEPETSFGYYDGWVEHDDLASSRYHQAGDKRLGEITSPTKDKVRYPPTTGEEYTAIAGADLGRNNPNAIGTPDTYVIAGGPGAVNSFGSNGYDAGDVCIVEWMTWRTDGTSRTYGDEWEDENGPYHPFAGPSTARTSGEFGFADYNLDGMIDQGEVRPELSENYSVDANPATINDGTHTDYPFNRRRMLEDVVQALDANLDWDDFVDPDRGNTVSGIVLVPSGSYNDINLFPLSPGFYPIHTEDTSFEPLFHDLVICQNCRDFPADVGYAAHEYLHAWEHYPDLYDYDIFDDGGVVNCPIGRFDIMAGIREGGTLVHPVPPLKELYSGWIKPVDFKSVLTPGVVTSLTLPPAELVRNDSYYYLENAEQPGERMYFWSAGSGLDEAFPTKGMLILQVRDINANNEAIALQQRTTPANFRIIQADGLGQMEACSSTGNDGDAGDMWPGSTDATQFNFNTNPRAVWTTQNRWTGLDIQNVEPDGNGSVRLTLSWTPTNIPSLTFIEPPGGESTSGSYQVRYRATDVHAGTTIELYYTQDSEDLAIGGNFINAKQKNAPGTVEDSQTWNVTNIPDGVYQVFAKLIPGPGLDGTEVKNTQPRARRGNIGTGSLNIVNVDVSSDPSSTARTETWTATYVDDPTDPYWVVYSSLTQPQPENPIPGPFTHAKTCPKNTADCTPFVYTSLNGEVTFYIKEGDTPFANGDAFNFTTTGITPPSAAVVVKNGRIKVTPTAVIHAAPLTIHAGETVDFDASDSTDPQDRALTFRWSFGDGTGADGESVSHKYTAAGTFTASLKVTNTDGLFGQDQVDIIVANNAPVASFSVPSSGPSPLTVTANAQGSVDVETGAADLIFQWDMGDGTTRNNQAEPGTLFQSVTATYSKCKDKSKCMAPDNPVTCPAACTPTLPCDCTTDCQCAFTIKLTVTDDANPPASTSVAHTVRVGNTNPIASVTVSANGGNAPLTVVFNASGSSDADGNTLTVDWDFGDGSPLLTDYPITGDDPPADGSVSHTYSQGTWTPSAVVKDGRGGEDTWLGNAISVQAPLPHNDPPSAAFTVDPDSKSGITGASFAFDASGSTDAQQANTELIYSWAFGDGALATGMQTTHVYTTAGQFQVELTVTDERGATDTATATINIVPPENRPPTAVIATGPRTGVAPALLTFDGRNSFDPDDDPLSYSWEIRDAGDLIDTATGTILNHVFEQPGSYSVLLEVDDGRGKDNSIDRSDPVTVTVTEAVAPPDNGGDGNGGGGQEPGAPIPDSADQRPTPTNFCGVGMIAGFFGSFLGLSLMFASRRRRRL